MPVICFRIFVVCYVRVVQKLAPDARARLIVKNESMQHILDQTPAHKPEAE
jgi:hypothetical protein